MQNPDRPLVRVGYVVKMFPRLSETFILNEILELERRGVEVVIFSLKKPSEGRFHPQVSSLKAAVHYLEDFEPSKWPNWIGKEWPILQLYSGSLFSLLDELLAKGDTGSEIANVWFSAWVASQAHKLGVQHLHAHFASQPSTIAYFAHRISGIPFSFTAHAKDIFVYSNEQHHLREKLHASAFTVTVTNFNRRYLTERVPDLPTDRIRVIHNGINLEYFVGNPRTVRKTNEVLAVGRLVTKKGFDDLLKACAVLKSKNQSFHCTIVGEGPDKEALETLQRDLGLLGEVTFVGPKNLSEVLELMQTCTVFCLPCTVAPDNNQDALPTVLLEALASQLPIVSTSVSGIPEIVDDNVDGFLVPQEQPDQVADRLMQLLKSPDLRARFALAGRKKAELKFDLRKNVETLLNEYIASATRHAGVKNAAGSIKMAEADRERN